MTFPDTETDPGLRVAVTGAAGNLGRRVVARLCELPEVARVVALDRAPIEARHPKLESAVCDVRDSELPRYFSGCDAVVHLAFVVERGSRDAADTEAINVGGTRNVFEAAAAAGVSQVVYASSLACYGFHADTDGVFLSEDAERRGNEEFYYGRHKAAIEHWLDGFEAAHPELRIARMRPGVFLGEDSPRSIGPLRLPVQFVLPGPESRAHVIHQDDVVEAFVLALLARARGAYNVTTEEPLTSTGMARAMGKPAVRVPHALLELYRWAWRRGRGDVDPIWIDIAGGYSLLGSSEKIRKELGWNPRYPTTGDVLRRLSRRPNALASHAAKAYLGMLVRLSRLFRGLRPGRDAPAETRRIETCVNLCLTGQRPSRWHFRVSGGRLFARPGLDDAARATITLDDRTFTELLAGRRDLTTASMTGKVRMRGDGEMGFLLAGLVEGFRTLREAKGLRGWPLRRFAARVLRDADLPRPSPPSPNREAA